MRSDIEFDADGTTLRGWLYLPPGHEGPHPAVVMAHGFTALKEMGLDDYAEVFAAAGLAVVVYDNRNLGASDGHPRGEVDPVAQMRDYRHALTFAESLPEIDDTRLGVWGTSYTGGLVLIAAALDRRVACVVSQVPMISGYESMVRIRPLAERREFARMVDAERRSRALGSPAGRVSVATDDPDEPATAPGRRTHHYFTTLAREKGVDWDNRVTIRSLELRLEYEAMPFMERISPTPLLMIVATDDEITPTDIALRAFDRALEPKKLVLVRGDHYDPYLGAFEASSAAARDWFAEHLGAPA
ncbi:MAG: alpha/beta hydrolase [Pseudonocardia sp.]